MALMQKVRNWKISHFVRKIGIRFSERLPNFLVLGTQKGGTTSLQKLLMQHPQIFLPTCKEVQYFTLNAEKPVSWYSDHYRNAKKGQLLGDITPYYLFHPKAATQIQALIPKARLIVLLRDPVERALSQYFHAKRHGFETLNLEDAFDAEEKRIASGDPFNHQKHSYISRSLYIKQLSRFEAVFPKEQILILSSEEFFNNTEKIWRKILSFIGAKIYPLPGPLSKENAGNNEATKIDPEFRLKLKNALKQTTREVKAKYGIDWGW